MKTLLTLVLSGIASICAAGQISSALDAEIRRAPDGTVSVVCYLKDQPGFEAAKPVKEAYQPQLLSLGAEAKMLSREGLYRNLNYLEQMRRKQLLEEINDLQDQRKRDIALALTVAAMPAIGEARSAMESLGGVPQGHTAIYSSVWGSMPASAIEDLSHHPRIAFIDLSKPEKPELDDHKHSLGLTNANGFWKQRLHGWGVRYRNS